MRHHITNVEAKLQSPLDLMVMLTIFDTPEQSHTHTYSPVLIVMDAISAKIASVSTNL